MQLWMPLVSSMQIKSVDFRNRNKEHLFKVLWAPPRGGGVGVRGGCQLSRLACREEPGRPWKLYFRCTTDGSG